MNKLVLVLVASLVLSGCANMSPGEKKAAYIIGGVLVVGAIAAQSNSSKTPQNENCFYHMNSDGSTSTVCR